MSKGKTSLSQEQKTFEIEERVYKLLTPEFRKNYQLYRKVHTFPEEHRQKFGNKTAEYLDAIASKIATNFILNSNNQPVIDEDIILEDYNMSQNNMNMQELAQLIASAISTAMNNKPNETSNIRIPVPSTYNGERSAAVINLWTEEVERYLEFNNVPHDRRLLYAITLLRGRAQKWWNQLEMKKEAPKTWETFKMMLEYAFKPSYSEQAARDKLANSKQVASVIDYVDTFQDILLDLPRISDDEALDRFVRGLKDDVRIHVLTREPRTLEEATRSAISYDSARQTGLTLPINRQDYAPNDPMDLSLLVQQLNAMVKSNRSNYQQQDGVLHRTNRNISCHWCNKPGHIKAECRSRLRELREFEQNRMRQNRSNGRNQYHRQRNSQYQTNNKAYHADLIQFEQSNDNHENRRPSNLNTFDSVNKDSLLELSPYSFDSSIDHEFLMNVSTCAALPTYEISIHGHKFHALIDTGASANYIHPKLLPLVNSYKPVSNQAVETANGEQTTISGETFCTLEVKGRGKNFINTFRAFVFKSKFDVILGNEWLKEVKPRPDWFDSSWTITNQNGEEIIMMPCEVVKDEKTTQHANSIVISAKQMERLFKTNQASECYLAQITFDRNQVNYVNSIKNTDQSWADVFSKEFPEVFKGQIVGLPPMRDTQDIIVTRPDAVPVARPPYKMSPLELAELRKQLDELLDKGLIEPCVSEWSNPVLFVRKPNGDLRMCCDYRMLNKVTIKQKVQLPRIDECLERLHNAKHFTSLDLTSGFHQQRLSEDDSLKTAISTRYGQYCWKVVPFGLSNSGPAFQKMMNGVLSEYIDKFVMVYLDDILIFTDGDEELHKKHVRLVLEKLNKAKLIINTKKCLFNRKELNFLGFNISAKGILPATKKVKAIMEWPTPTNVQQVRQFMGLAQHYRRFIKDFAGIAAPITELTKGSGAKCRSIQWNENCQRSFDLIKKKMSSAPVLMNPDMNKPFRIECDASDFAIGAVLLQESSQGVWKPLAFESKKLSKAERNYPAQERELLSILHALRTWRCFIDGNEYQVFTDHLPLKYLRSQKNPTPRLVRWLSEVELYDPEILYKPGKENQVPDLLSRRDGPNTIPEEKSMEPRYLYHIKAHKDNTSLLDKDPIQDWPLHYLSTEDKWPVKIKEELKNRKHHFLVRNQQVFKKEKFRDSESFKELKFIPFARRADLIDDFHAGYGHSGQTSVYQLMKTRVWWPHIKDDINLWISRCSKCQLASSSDKSTHHAPMKPLEVPPAFSRWHLDFIGELPTTKHGNKWILMAVDYTTNWPIAKALQNATGEEIVKFIYEEIVMRFGCPEEIISDRGSNFMSKVVKQYMRKIKTKHNLTSAFHPRSNGKCERLNQTFKRMLIKYVNGEVHSWDEHMDTALFACRIRKHATTGFSPFYLTYGVEPKIPGDSHRPFISTLTEQDSELLSQDVLTHLRKLREDRYIAEDRLRRQAELDKTKWDSMLKNNQIQTFNVGDYVLLRHESKTGLEFQWMGPYKVIKRNLDFNTYQIQEIEGKLYNSWVHTDRLHPVKYDGSSINKSWYIPRVARSDSIAKLSIPQ